MTNSSTQPINRQPLSTKELIQQANQELQSAGLKVDPSLKLKPGEMVVQFFREKPKYPKK